MKSHPLAMLTGLAAAALLLVGVPAGCAPVHNDPAPAADDLVSQLTSSSPDEAFQAAMTLEGQLRAGDNKAEDLAAKVVAAREKIVTTKDVLALVSDDLGKKPVLAARLLVSIARAQMIVTRMKKGSVVVGQISVEDGKADPEDVLAQMPILPEGYFAGEVGDLKRPIGFRSHGYANLDVPLEGKTGDLVYVGKSVLKPLKKEEAATLKGTIALDAAKTAEGATVTITMDVPPPNTPHNGYSPRMHWPQGVAVPISKTGEFVATGLSPSAYRVSVSADGHTPYATAVSFKPGEEHDAGTITLRSTDIGFYIGKPAPNVGELKWEKDYAAALARAKEEKKPILIMETATWCGWCKKLEKDTLDDAWVRYALSGYVIVQAFEDKEVEGKYGCEGYPTLIFADSTGKLAYKFSGYREIAPFLGQLAAADEKLDLALPEELQTLLDKKIIVLGGE